jgi:tetratricopeptide (TPR) repeat protein
MRRLTAATVAALGAATALLLGGLGGEPSTATASPLEAQAAATRGYAALDEARVRVDPSRYAVAEREFREALRLGRADGLALRGLASLAAARHRFDESLRLAERARSVEPRNASVYGLLGDANVELGRYRAAFAAFDRMALLKPGPTAYARVSYGRELLGDTDGAIEAMRLSAEAAAAGEPRAWALAHVANLYLATGRLKTAERLFRDTLRIVPGYAPALGGLARIANADGQLALAERRYRAALRGTPAPEYATSLAGVLLRLGRRDEANALLARARAIEQRFARYGGRSQLETALLDLDHDRNLRDALRRARIGARLRPSVEGEHVLAWALYKNGRCLEAQRHSRRALRLGTKDVGALYHRALIERCLGHPDAARRFLLRMRRIDPYFEATAPSPYRLRPTIAAWPRSRN